MSILTHQREERKQQQSRRKEERKETVFSEDSHRTPLALHPSFPLWYYHAQLCELFFFCSLLEQHQRLRGGGEDAEDDGEDEEMTSVCGTGLHGAGRPGVPAAFNQMEFDPFGWRGYGRVRHFLIQ